MQGWDRREGRLVGLLESLDVKAACDSQLLVPEQIFLVILFPLQAYFPFLSPGCLAGLA